MPDIIDSARKSLRNQLMNSLIDEYVPTGIQDKCILALGEGKHEHYHIQMPNKVGKTTFLVNLIGNIAGILENPYFDCDLYRNWPFPKNLCLVGTKENLKDAGPIRNEIIKWWPRDRYTEDKQGNNYYSLYKFDTGFNLIMFSNEQAAKQFEGPLFGLWLMDEPGKDWMIGALNSRLAEGGLGITAFTPIEAGPMIDAVEDMERSGVKVKYLLCNDIWENHKETGLENRDGSKKGLYSTKQIDDYIRRTPQSEREARLQGKANYKAGRVYRDFNAQVHVRDFDLHHSSTKLWECQMVMDPHRKYYPFMQWWAITPDNLHVLWNEWPTYDDFGMYYDEIRNTEICPYAPDILSKFIKTCDLPALGMNVTERYLDPIFARGAAAEFGKAESLVQEFIKHDVEFILPPIQRKDVQRNVLMELLRYDKQKPISSLNQPDIYIMPHCKNSIRSFERHYWEEGKETEAERYKDPVDCARMRLAGLGRTEYKQAEGKHMAQRLDFRAEQPKNVSGGLG